jgi:hypothetical protein
MIEAQVAGKDHIAIRSFDNDTHRVGDSVIDGKEAHTDSANFDSVFLLHLVYVERFKVWELLLPLADHHRC